MTTIESYLDRPSTRPIGCIHSDSAHVAGRIYVIGSVMITKMKFSYSQQSGMTGHSYSMPVYRDLDRDCPEIVKKLQKKGWTGPTCMTLPNNGYEVYCFEKDEVFKGLGDGEYIGYIWYSGKILESKADIIDYINDNTYDMNPIYLYKKPKNLK